MGDPIGPRDKVDNYFVQEEIGRGRYGKVFAAIDQNTNRHYALKVQSMRSFRMVNKNEFRILKQIRNYPGVLHLVEHLIFDKWNAFVSEKLGVSVKQVVYKTGLSVTNAIKLGLELMDSLNFLKSKNIVHQDLHEGNVLFDLQCTRSVIIDFGISWKKDEDRLEFRWFKVPYFSPDANRGGNYEFFDDVVSAGFLLLFTQAASDLYRDDHNRDNMMKKKRSLLAGGEELHDTILPNVRFLEAFFQELHNQQKQEVNYEELKKSLISFFPEFKQEDPYETDIVDGQPWPS